jgi:hypothetical protein
LLATKWPHLNAKVIIPLSLQLLHILPSELYNLLVKHPYASLKESVFYKKNNPSVLMRKNSLPSQKHNIDSTKQQQQQQQQQNEPKLG